MEQYNIFSVLTREIESRMNGSETLPLARAALVSQIACVSVTLLLPFRLL